MYKNRDIKKARQMYDLYSRGFSLAQVGKAFGVTRQAVFKMLKKNNYKLRKKLTLPFIIWNEVKYTIRKNGFYAKTSSKRTYLHRDVWEFHYGIIPKNHDVHHKNGDKTDNRIENLELLHCSDHGKIHGFCGNQNIKISYPARPIISQQKGSLSL